MPQPATRGPLPPPDPDRLPGGSSGVLHDNLVCGFFLVGVSSGFQLPTVGINDMRGVKAGVLSMVLVGLVLAADSGALPWVQGAVVIEGADLRAAVDLTPQDITATPSARADTDRVGALAHYPAEPRHDLVQRLHRPMLADESRSGRAIAGIRRPERSLLGPATLMRGGGTPIRPLTGNAGIRCRVLRTRPARLSHRLSRFVSPSHLVLRGVRQQDTC